MRVRVLAHERVCVHVYVRVLNRAMNNLQVNCELCYFIHRQKCYWISTGTGSNLLKLVLHNMTFGIMVKFEHGLSVFPKSIRASVAVPYRLMASDSVYESRTSVIGICRRIDNIHY